MSSEQASQQNGQDAQSTNKNKKRAREGPQEQVPSKKQKQSQAAAPQTRTNLSTSALPNGSEHKRKKNKNRGPADNVTTSNTVSLPSRKRISLGSDNLNKQSPFICETQSLFVGLSPIAHRFPLEGACAEFISPLLLTYYPPLNGVVLSYSNPRLTQHPEQACQASNGQNNISAMGRSIDEYAVTYIWLTADFLVFRPSIGTVLEGHVNLQNQSILGLLCYNYFNAGIDQSRLPSDWKWVEEQEFDDGTIAQGDNVPQNNGHFVDGDGKIVQGKILFKVKDFEANAGVDGGTSSINIYGTLIRDQDDNKIDAELRQRALVS